MIAFNIRLDKLLSPSIAQLRAGLSPVIDKAAMDTASYGKSLIIRSTAKGATGLTQGGWSIRKLSNAVYQIINRFKHAQFLETGTGLFGPRRQMIKSPNGKLMRWRNWAKNTVTGWTSAWETRGMPAQPAIEPNVNKIQKDLNIRIRNAIRKLWQAVKK